MVVQQEIPGEQWSAGIGYIICPNDIDRDVYIKDCYLNNRVSIKMDIDSSAVNRVPISIDVLNFIDFPLESKELGTAVAYVTDPIHKQPMIIARFEKSNQLGDGREGVFQIYRKFGDKLVGITGDVQSGFLGVNINAGDKKGNFKISLDNDNDDCIAEVEVAGSIFIQTTDGTRIENKNEFKSVVQNDDEDKEKPSIISQTRSRSLLANKQLVINGEEIECIHYKGYKIKIDDNGIQIDALDKEVNIQAGNNKIQMNSKGIDIEGDNVNINGSFEVLYNTIPGTPIANVGQIGSSKKVKVG